MLGSKGSMWWSSRELNRSWKWLWWKYGCLSIVYRYSNATRILLGHLRCLDAGVSNFQWYDGFILFLDTISKITNCKNTFFSVFWNPACGLRIEWLWVHFWKHIWPVWAPRSTKHSDLENVILEPRLAFRGPLQSASNALLRVLWWFHIISWHFSKKQKLQTYFLDFMKRGLWLEDGVIRCPFLDTHWGQFWFLEAQHAVFYKRDSGANAGF